MPGGPVLLVPPCCAGQFCGNGGVTLLETSCMGGQPGCLHALKWMPRTEQWPAVARCVEWCLLFLRPVHVHNPDAVSVAQLAQTNAVLRCVCVAGSSDVAGLTNLARSRSLQKLGLTWTMQTLRIFMRSSHSRR